MVGEDAAVVSVSVTPSHACWSVVATCDVLVNEPTVIVDSMLLIVTVIVSAADQVPVIVIVDTCVTCFAAPSQRLVAIAHLSWNWYAIYRRWKRVIKFPVYGVLPECVAIPHRVMDDHLAPVQMFPLREEWVDVNKRVS